MNRIRVIVLLEVGQQFKAYTVPEVFCIEVGEVSHVLEATQFKESQYVFPCQAYERSDDAWMTNRGDAGEPQGACPSQQMHEDGFSIVICMMPKGNLAGRILGRDLIIEGVTSYPGCLLEG